jgi:5,6-dimethylbenzimidazole synthase
MTVDFLEIERKGVYKAIFNRRDVRADFKPDPIPDEVLARLLSAAHHSASVGFMQPWNFVVIRDIETKHRVKALFQRENEMASGNYEGERRDLYLSLKLEGILEAPVNLCVTCDRDRGGPHVLGRNTMRDTDLFSTCCAIQNLWLAARSEGIGVGWVSILDPDELKKVLQIPESISLVAYLCVGYVRKFAERPLLEEAGWRGRLNLADLVFFERWGERKQGWLEGKDVAES